MFSGIVKVMGSVAGIEHTGSTLHVTITSPVSDELSVDQSVSHDGVCLTVVETGAGFHKVDIVRETQSKTTLGKLAIGQPVNLETALSLSSLIDGHLVQGHVDAKLKCLSTTNEDGSRIFTFSLPAEYAALVVPRGSICINGVSLTIARLAQSSFSVAIIPYTYEHTNFSKLKSGEEVNVEFDVVGKYLLRHLALRDA